MKKLEKLAEFEHHYNPEHFYCRLRELEIPKEEAKRWSEIYELGVYKNIMEELKNYRGDN